MWGKVFQAFYEWQKIIFCDGDILREKVFQQLLMESCSGNWGMITNEEIMDARDSDVKIKKVLFEWSGKHWIEVSFYTKKKYEADQKRRLQNSKKKSF